MRILLTGATGFIGTATLAGLAAAGHEVVAVSRRPQHNRPLPAVAWVTLDMREAARPEAWLPLLGGIDAVVNCAGVLQSNASDSVLAAHVTGPTALFAACEQAGVARAIQISAIGVDRGAPTEFARTKADGDTALKRTRLDWVILRPSVVVGRPAYGGSALLRALAALPFIPSIRDAGRLQIVQLDELVATVLFFLSPGAPARLELDIAAPEQLSLEEVLTIYRQWLGWRPAPILRMPSALVGGAFRLGDLAGWLGWRPPVRGTAQQELARGVTGDPSGWMRLTGIAPRPLRQALAAEPASVQERWFAKLYLLKPLVLATLSLFWICTAAIALGPGWDAGAGLLPAEGATDAAVPLIVMAASLADLLVGVGIAVRHTARRALQAGIALSFAYLAIGTVLIPRLWIDPLGPMLKVLPILALMFVALAILDDR